MTTPRYKITYWPIAFRGCFVTYLFAYAGVDFALEDDLDAIIAMKSADCADQASPLFGPPLVEDSETGLALNQVPAIVSYYAPQFGLWPDDPVQAARCLKIQMDCNDLLMEICCYNGTSMWTREAWQVFRANRLPRWMRLFEEEFKRGALGGATVTAADIAVYALFGPMMNSLPDLVPDLRAAGPNIVALCEKIGQTPKLAAYVAQERARYGQEYCSGQIEESIRSQLALDREAAE